MELTMIYMTRICQQFDSFCKMVLRGEACKYRKERARRTEREITFSEMSESEMNSLQTVDEYKTDIYVYEVHGYKIEVRDDLIACAIEQLPDKKRNIILLSCFLNMIDTVIAKLMGNDRSTISQHRRSTLKQLENMIKEDESNG